MLRTNFTKGLTNLTMLTADEQAGVILTILIIAQLDEGKRLLAENFQANAEDVIMLPLYTNDDMILLDEDESEEDDFVVKSKTETSFIAPQCSFNDFLQVIEMMLAFHSWYKSTIPIQWDPIHSKKRLKNSIVLMLDTIARVLPRHGGFGWRLQKFHEHLHIL
jgi:hypothetical protein